ncbi:MAG: esterase family protein [Lachnospiraceae bacterium]|nr:esterase family protein [Lachnospiraceae bacterium]
MKKSKMAALLLSAVMAAGSALVLPPVESLAATPDESKYVSLEGDWNYKLYRKYSQMFQYYEYFGVDGYLVWEDNALATLPDKDTFSQWETMSMPYDSYATGGLLPVERAGMTVEDGEGFDPSTAILPKWSEAWACRTFDLPADFTNQENVTLLLGIIDDCDVVYINGQNVASSGFVNNAATPEKLRDTGLTGGFDYSNADGASQVRFEKSYWEVERKYTIPTSVLNLGGENTICVRVYNNNGNGGFYTGHAYAICGNDLAVRKVQGLPTDVVGESGLMETIQAQIDAIEAKDATAYATTVAEDYHKDALNKASRVSEVMNPLADYTNIQVEDANADTYLDAAGLYWYSAIRTIRGTKEGVESVILTTTLEECFKKNADGSFSEFGNQNRCYSTSYYSELLGKDATYSVYLPPSYYEDSTKTYPVVYLLHGINSSSSSFVKVDKIGAFMDQQIGDGNIGEMILIMPDAGKNSFYRNTEGQVSDSTGPWQSFITEDVVSMADRTYRTKAEAKYRGLTGISMGGYGAMTIGSTFTEEFSSIASHMGYLAEDALDCLRSMTDEQLADYDFYLDCGLQDNMVDYRNTVAAHEYLESKGKAHGYSIRDGSHNSAFYMAGMPASMKMHSQHFYPTASVETPDEAPAETPAEVPSKTPVVVPSETPANQTPGTTAEQTSTNEENKDVVADLTELKATTQTGNLEIKISGIKNLPQGSNLIANVMTSGQIYDNIKKSLADMNQSNFVFLDLSIDLPDGSKFQPTEPVTVSIPYPSGWTGFVSLYYMDDNGKVLDTIPVSVVEANGEKMIRAQLSHFSNYVIAEKQTTAQNTTQDTSKDTAQDATKDIQQNVSGNTTPSATQSVSQGTVRTSPKTGEPRAWGGALVVISMIVAAAGLIYFKKRTE